MDSSLFFDTLDMGWSIVHIEESHAVISKYKLSLKIVYVFGNSVDPDEMLHYVAFHLGFTVCQSTHLGVTSM